MVHGVIQNFRRKLHRTPIIPNQRRITIRADLSTPGSQLVLTAFRVVRRKPQLPFLRQLGQRADGRIRGIRRTKQERHTAGNRTGQRNGNLTQARINRKITGGVVRVAGSGLGNDQPNHRDRDGIQSGRSRTGATRDSFSRLEGTNHSTYNQNASQHLQNLGSGGTGATSDGLTRNKRSARHNTNGHTIGLNRPRAQLIHLALHRGSNHNRVLVITRLRGGNGLAVSQQLPVLLIELFQREPHRRSHLRNNSLVFRLQTSHRTEMV